MKYKPGDQVIFVHNAKLLRGTIEDALCVARSQNDTEESFVAYHIKRKDLCIYLKEHECFSTKEELIESLNSQTI